MAHKKMDLVQDLMNEPEGSLEPLGSYLKEFQDDVTIDSYLERFRKVVMLMKKYPIRSSATTIEALDGLGALPQETLEYLEIQPPVEAMLSCWIMNEFLSEKSSKTKTRSSGKRKITDQCTELSTKETPLSIKKPTLSKKSVSKGKKRSFQKLDEDSTSNRKACETFCTSSTEEWSRNLCSARTSAGSLQTSVHVSITKGKNLGPFWNSRCREISKNLWLPQGTGWQDSLQNSLPGSSLGAVGGFSFTTKSIQPPELQRWTSQRICLPSSLCSAVESKGDDATVVRNMKVRLFPTRMQSEWIVKCQDGLRALRNIAIEMVHKKWLNVYQITSKMVSIEDLVNSSTTLVCLMSLIRCHLGNVRRCWKIIMRNGEPLMKYLTNFVRIIWGNLKQIRRQISRNLRWDRSKNST